MVSTRPSQGSGGERRMTAEGVDLEAERIRGRVEESWAPRREMKAAMTSQGCRSFGAADCAVTSRRKWSMSERRRGCLEERIEAACAPIIWASYRCELIVHIRAVFFSLPVLQDPQRSILIPPDH